MNVKPIPGEPLRFSVHSESDPHSTHVVDLHMRGGNGECSCRDFETRRGPNWDNNGHVVVEYARDNEGKAISGATRCKHIRAAVLWWANNELALRSRQPSAATKPMTIRESADGFPF